MSSQLQVYRSYLPTREQIKPFAIAAIVVIAVFSFASMVFGQNTPSSVVDQAITSITEESEPAKEENTEEAGTSATVAQAVNNQTQKQQEAKEAAAKAEAEKKKQAEKKAQQEKLASAVSTSEEMPNTGPVENAIVTVAVVAIGYTARNFIRSKAELVRAVEKA